MSVEEQRGRIVAKFVLLNLADDVLSGAANVFGSAAGFFKSASVSLRFAQYDQARKYADLTGGDFGRVIGCPGHYDGDCAHTAGVAEEDDDD